MVKLRMDLWELVRKQAEDADPGMDSGQALDFLREAMGVQLVTSDAHQGLKDAIVTFFSGASWQRCRTHFMTNLLSKVPKRAQPWVATMVRTIYQQPSPEEVHVQHQRMVGMLDERFSQAAELLEAKGPDALAFTAFPVAHRKQVWSNNPQERLNKEIRRRTDVVGIFPNRAATRRLIGAVLAEQYDEWQVSRRYLASPVLDVGAEERMEDPLLLPSGANRRRGWRCYTT
jgi:transposase-like protein